MTRFKRRLLLSLSAAALAVPMAGGSAQAIEVVVLEQVNTASETTVVTFESLWGESLAATAAAIGNSAAFNVEGVDDVASLDLEQINTGEGHAIEGEGTQLAGIGVVGTDLTAGTAEGLSLTAAAIGNTLSGSGAGTVGELDILQVNIDGDVSDGIEGQGAVILADADAIGGLESTLSAAAIGNSASLAAGAIGSVDDFDTVFQYNSGNQIAIVDLNELAVVPTEIGATFDVTAAALGNSLTLDAETGDLFLDEVLQVNEGDSNFDDLYLGDEVNLRFGQYAHVDLYEINDFDPPDTPVGVDAPSFERFDATLVTAAIGNSGTLSAGGTVLLDDISQFNDATQEADIELDDVYGLGDLTATAVAIGNSLSISAGENVAFDKFSGGITQINDPETDDFGDGLGQDIDFDLDDLDALGNFDLTAAAIGNSLTIDAEGAFDLGDTNALDQQNYDPQDSEIELKEMAGLGDVSATVVAIGNSMSLSSGGDFDLGTDGTLSQVNTVHQDAEIELEDEINGTGAIDFTVAAIGNSLSIDAGGTLSGIGGEITQVNVGEFGQESEIEPDGFDTMGDFASLDATVVAIGNSLSLSAGSFAGTGVLEVSQLNEVSQLASVDLSDSGLGAMSTTAAAIGNSASVTIK